MGGADADIFVFGEGDGSDRIKDFEDGLDVIDVSEFGLSGVDDILDMTTEDKRGIDIDFGNGDKLEIYGVAYKDITADWFDFT